MTLVVPFFYAQFSLPKMLISQQVLIFKVASCQICFFIPNTANSFYCFVFWRTRGPSDKALA